jgi:hypothetical protein
MHVEVLVSAAGAEMRLYLRHVLAIKPSFANARQACDRYKKKVIDRRSVFFPAERALWRQAVQAV